MREERERGTEVPVNSLSSQRVLFFRTMCDFVQWRKNLKRGRVRGRERGREGGREGERVVHKHFSVILYS